MLPREFSKTDDGTIVFESSIIIRRVSRSKKKESYIIFHLTFVSFTKMGEMNIL